MTRSLRALAPAVLGVLLLAGCGAKPPAAAPPTHPAAAPPPPAAPKVGACYGMSMKQTLGWTTSSKPKPCNATHTAETFFVGELDTAVDGHLVAVDSDRVQAQVIGACRSKVASFVGGTPDQLRLSMVRPVWFTPTVAQSDHGANWFRCDAVVVASPDALSPRLGTLKGVLKGAASRTAVSMCGTDAPTAKDFHRVLCSAKHSWRAVAVVPMKPGKYPGEKTARGAAGSRCEQAASATAKDPLSFQFGYEFPTAADWGNGQTYGICWAKG